MYSESNQIYSDPKAQTSKVKPAREVDNLLDMQEKQVQFLVETMRRVEDLADRVSGSQPSADIDDKYPEFGEGYIGALHRQRADRDMAISRIANAMSRIEQNI